MKLISVASLLGSLICAHFSHWTHLLTHTKSKKKKIILNTKLKADDLNKIVKEISLFMKLRKKKRLN